MNNDYNSYLEYVKGTEYYNDLKNAVKKARTIKGNIDILISALRKNNGPNITLAINDLEKFKSNLDKIINYYLQLSNSLCMNAGSFDTTMEWIKTEYVAKGFSTKYYFDGASCNYSVDVYMDKTHYATKVISSYKVDISRGGYIRLIEYKDFIDYTLKKSIFNIPINRIFHIDSGTPTDIIDKKLTFTESPTLYYTKGKQTINPSK